MKKLLCEEEWEDGEAPQVKSDLTNKFKRKWIYLPEVRNNSNLGEGSFKSSSYQHSLMKNKNLETGFNPTTSGLYTSLGNIQELSFTRTNAEVELYKKFKKNGNFQIENKRKRKKL